MTSSTAAGHGDWLKAPGAMARLIRQNEWTATALGPLAEWNPQLRSAVEQLLHMPFPSLLLHGPQHIALYNDRSADFLSDLHPGLFGQPLENAWSALSSCCGAAIERALAGTPAAIVGHTMTLTRRGRPQRLSLDLHFIPVPDGDGRPMAVQVIIDDLTARRQAEHALRRDAEQMTTIFGQAQVGLSELSLEGRFVRVNGELSRMLGRDTQTLLQMGIAEVTHPDDLGHSLDAVGRLIATGEPVSIDKRYVRPDGTVVWANSRVSLLNPVQWQACATLLAVTVDLTERTLITQALAASEARFRALAEASPLLIWQFEPDGTLGYYNPSCERLFAAAGVAPHDWRELLGGEDAAPFLQQLAQAQQQQAPLQARVSIHPRGGPVRWIESYIAPWFRAPQEYAGHVGVSVDISDMIEAQNQLMIANERLNLAIEGSGDGLWDWDLVRQEITVSEQMRQIAGAGELPGGHSVAFWRDITHPDDLEQISTAMHAMLTGAAPTFRAEYRIRAGADGWKWLLTRAVVVARGADGAPLRVAGLATDISARRASQDKVWRHANFDALTGLPNRRLFRSKLDHEVTLTQRTGTLLGLLFIDLDHFKQANDLLGHDAGDQLLVQAARRIQACVRGADTVARLGGDEFTAILMPIDDVFDAEQIAGKINQTLSEPFVHGADVVHLSASIGITICPNDGADAATLIRNADQAMYVAKNSGRGQFNYFTPAMQEAAQYRVRLIAELRMALPLAQMEVHFQPVVALASGQLVMAEALLRWNHPRLGMLGPVDFMPFAEESGLIADIGDWAFQQAARYAHRWRRILGKNFRVSVNRSLVQFMARPHGSNWPAYMRSEHLAGSGISVEITEPVLLNASPKVGLQLQQYKAAGMQVSIDDFGSGCSSLSYLKRYDVDYLKIGQHFVRRLQQDAGDRSIIRSVTAMAHELGPQVIAVGIETVQQKNLLAGAGCDFGQGFYFSPPLPPAQFEQRLRRGASFDGKPEPA